MLQVRSILQQFLQLQDPVSPTLDSKVIIELLGFVMASLVASSEAQLPLHVLHGKCQETCSFPSNFSNPFQNTWSLKMEHLKGKLQQFLHIADISFAER